MKRKLLILSLGMGMALQLSAQLIPNPGFENWNTTNYEEPQPWRTSNSENIRRGGPINVTKVPGVNGFAIRMETSIINPDTFNAYVFNGIGDPMSGAGGVPFSQLPTSITGSYRYNLGANDTALILVMFKKNGSVISMDLIKIKGTGSQPAFTGFSFPLNVPVTPDSVILAAASSNAIANIGVTNGSFLELDNLNFGGPGVTQSLQGGDFETWTMNSFEELAGWTTEGEGVSKVSPGYSGSFAVQLLTLDYGPQEGIHPSSISLGQQSQSGPTGGIPYNHQTDTLCGYYRYSTPGLDSGAIFYNTLSNGSNSGGGYLRFGPANNWTYFEIPILSFGTPDTLNLNISSSSNYPVDNTTAGSTLILDGIQLKSEIVGIKTNGPSDMIIKSFPNPASDYVTISLNKVRTEAALVNVYSITGKLMITENLPAGSAYCSLNLRNYETGTYFIQVITSSGTFKTAFIKK